MGSFEARLRRLEETMPAQGESASIEAQIALHVLNSVLRLRLQKDKTCLNEDERGALLRLLKRRKDGLPPDEGDEEIWGRIVELYLDECMPDEDDREEEKPP